MTTATSAPEAAPPSQAALAWVETFTELWRPGAADTWRARYQDVFHPDVRLIQPLSPPAVGHAGAGAWMESVFGLIPDLHAEVDGWSASGDVLYIDFVLKGTLGGRPIAWRACDRLTLRDGLMIERESYFDALPLSMTMLARPKAWPAIARSGSAKQLIKSFTSRGGNR